MTTKHEHYEFSQPDPKAPRINKKAADRIQPTCTGMNAKGELTWEAKAMAAWQMAMFPIRYVGDFINFWWKSTIRDKWGDEMEDMPSLTFRSYDHLKKQRKQHKGD